MDTAAHARTSLARSAAAFLAIGLLLYAALYAAAEQLLLQRAHANPFHRILTLQAPAPDWIILGSSHAMPLGFGGGATALERATGLRILNLASTGAGPLYSRLVLEHYLRRHGGANVLYVVDSFGFHSREWNEDRFADARLLARTPWDPQLAQALGGYVLREGVSWRVLLAYVTGFPKINNAQRFQRDAWEGEAQFERTWRISASSVKKRIDYLYPDGTPAEARDRYMAQFERLVRTVRDGGGRVVVVKLPLPPAFRAQLPQEAEFDAVLLPAALLAGAELHDFSAALGELRYYFDSDHLNRAGVEALVSQHLKDVLLRSQAADPVVVPRGAPSAAPAARPVRPVVRSGRRRQPTRRAVRPAPGAARVDEPDRG